MPTPSTSVNTRRLRALMPRARRHRVTVGLDDSFVVNDKP